MLTISEFKSVISTAATSGSEDQELVGAKEKVEDVTQVYNTFIGDLNAIMNGYLVAREKEKEAKEKMKEVREWLSVGIPASRHDGFSKTRVAGSGTWFVESREFKDWVTGETQVLVGSGSGLTPSNIGI
jgi:hypothetical protein